MKDKNVHSLSSCKLLKYFDASFGLTEGRRCFVYGRVPNPGKF
jgi:hypothetical protein